MKRLVLLFILLLGIIPIVYTQEIKNGSIIYLGKEYNIEFIEKDGKVFISWIDLNNALPNWFVVNKDGKIEVSMELLALIYSGITQQSSGPETSGTVIESRIDGDFEGWDGETIFKLQNGQIWQQDEYAYTYSYKYSPKVTILKSSRGWIMQVDGMSKSIRVKRLK